MGQARVGKSGNDLAGLRDCEPVEIQAQADSIIIRRIDPVMTLDALFDGKTAEVWRAFYACAYDWDPDLGREAVGE